MRGNELELNSQLRQSGCGEATVSATPSGGEALAEAERVVGGVVGAADVHPPPEAAPVGSSGHLPCFRTENEPKQMKEK